MSNYTIQDIFKTYGPGYIKKYKLSKELSEIKNLKRWAIVFVNDKCYANEEI